jgi:tRNA(fMet)-specific endonuclease VapC
MTDPVAVVDTDVASALFGHHYLGRPLKTTLSAVVQRYRPLISVITLGEARYGMAKGKWGAERAKRLVEFYHRAFVVLPVQEHVADEYGRLRAATEAAGRPVADNDLWIAATATAVDVALVTLNRRHFEPLALHGLTLL